MGQAVADLPDPIESATPADAQSADDLLSQLAGDEIDRMLAESDGDPAPTPASPPPASPPPAKTAQAVAPVAAAPTASAPPVAADAPPAAAAESVDLDAVLETAVADHTTAAAERSALQGTASAAIVAPPADISPQIELGDPARRVPLFLRPLEWLSSPLDPWPDQIREIIGKVGLMTLINALAVLAYVLLVRRHHH